MTPQIKIVGSIVVVMLLLIIILMIECNYIQYGFGNIRYESPPKVWRWNEITQDKGKEINARRNP